MGVYCNAHLIYGYLRDDETEALFSAIEEADEKRRNEKLEEPEKESEELEEEGDDYRSFEERFQEEQERHKVSLLTVGYSGVDVLTAKEYATSAKSFAYEAIPEFGDTKECDDHLASFFFDIGVAQSYPASWILIGYMD